MHEDFEKNYDEKEQSEELALADASPKTCGRCGIKLMEQERFCHNCGYPVSFEKKDTSQTKNIKKKRGVKNFAVDIVKRSLVLALAIFMIISVFLPLVRVDDENFDQEVKIKYSSIDGIVMFVNSCFSLDGEELIEEWDDIDDLEDRYEDDWEEGEELDKLESYVKETQKILLRSEKITVTVGKVFVLILSVIQILLSLSLATFAIFSFVSLFTRKTRFLKTSFLLLGMNVGVMFTSAFALKNEFFLHMGESKIAAAPIWALILVICLAIAFFVLRLAVDKEKMRVGTLVKHSLGLVFALAIVIFAFAPMVNTEIKSTFTNTEEEKKATSSLDSSLFYELNWNEQTKEIVEDFEDNEDGSSEKYDVARDYFSEFNNFSRRDFEKGEAKAANQEMYSWLLLAWGAYEYSGWYALGGEVMVVIVLCALLLIIQTLYELAMGKRIDLAFSYTVKSVAIVLAIVILVLTIVTIAVVNNNAEIVDSIRYKASIAYGPIVMLIFAVATICVPPAISKRKLQRDWTLEQREYNFQQ